MRRVFPYVLALVAYVALGYWLKSAVLNWIIGPLWLLLVFEVVPRALGFRPIGEDPEDSPTP
jgi:hypothetical protein